MGNGTTPSIRERLPHENIIALCYFWMKPKLCSAAHNLQYVPFVIMRSAQRELPESLRTRANCST